jgi:hypothetical protein
MNYPQKIIQVNNANLTTPPTAPATAPNGVKYPAPHPELGQFVRW